MAASLQSRWWHIAAHFAILLSFWIRPIPASAESLTAPYQVSGSYDGIVSRRFYMSGADGTQLPITLHRPTRGGRVELAPLPVILQQSRGISAGPLEVARKRFFTDRGYIWMTQSRRGSGASFGTETDIITRYDALDAKSAIEWAGAQPFSNGRLVTCGCSICVCGGAPHSPQPAATGQAFGAPPMADGEPVTLTLYRDAARLSRIDLPLKELQP